MADPLGSPTPRTTDMSRILENVEQELNNPTPTSSQQRERGLEPRAEGAGNRGSAVVESFAPPRLRNAGDNLAQIQQDFSKAVMDLESRFKTLIEELKRVAS